MTIVSVSLIVSSTTNPGYLDLRFYHFFLGPLLWWRAPPADAHLVASAVPDYRVRRDEPEDAVVKPTGMYRLLSFFHLTY